MPKTPAWQRKGGQRVGGRGGGIERGGVVNVLSLCAGVGGLDLGVELATGGIARTVCFVERETHAAAILAARMEEELLAPAPIWSDLTSFDGREWRGVVDCVAAGYPCQPFSTAGRRAGVDDPRHLWPHVARIIRETGTDWAFLENVPGHLSLGFDDVCRELQGMGFVVAAGLFSAAEVGASHRRERLFVLAHRDGGQGELGYSSMSRLPRGLYGQGDDAEGREAQTGRTTADGLPSWPPRPMSDWTGIPERLWPATAKPGVRGMADGLAGRVDRLRACGNGVVPLAAANAFRTLTAALAGRMTEDR